MSKKVVLITGASAGMGKETAQLLLQNGYTVYGAARRLQKMQDIESQGAKILKMDVSDEASIMKGVDEIIQTEGRIDILINNAGFGAYGAIEDVSIKDARYQMEVNVFGLARLSQLVIPSMRKQQFGKIVNITSIGGKIVSPLAGWYHASKFAVEALSDSLRMEVKSFGIDVIVIEPGGVKSEWLDIALDNLEKISGSTAYKGIVEKSIPMYKRFEPKNADPAVIAKLILKAITAKRPKTRYHGGFMAGPILAARKLLSDKMIDRILLSQIK